MQSHLQVVSFYARDSVSDDVVIRLRNSISTEGGDAIQVDLHSFFVQSRRVFGLRPRTLDLTAPKSLLAQLKLGDVSSEATATSTLEVGVGAIRKDSVESPGGKFNSDEDGVFLSDHAVRERTTLGIKVDGASVSIQAGQLQSFLAVFVTLKDKDLPIPSRTKAESKGSHGKDIYPTHLEVPTEVPHPEKQSEVGADVRVDAPSSPQIVRVSSHEGMEKEDLRKKIEKDKKMIAVLENRVKRFKALIDDLSQDLKLMGDDDESEDKLEMVQELSKTEDQLEQASGQLEQRKGNQNASMPA